MKKEILTKSIPQFLLTIFIFTWLITSVFNTIDNITNGDINKNPWINYPLLMSGVIGVYLITYKIITKKRIKKGVIKPEESVKKPGCKTCGKK
jgi:p-aminobenzoyl-glutamate transporter AbgT